MEKHNEELEEARKYRPDNWAQNLQRRYQDSCQMLNMGTRIKAIGWSKICSWRIAPPLEWIKKESASAIQNLIDLANSEALWFSKHPGPIVVSCDEFYFPYTQIDMNGLVNLKAQGFQKAWCIELFSQEGLPDGKATNNTKQKPKARKGK